MRWKSFAVGIAAALALPFSAQAAGAHHRYAGAVTSVSATSLTLNVDGTSVTLAIAPSARIVYGKGQTTLDVGDLVRVRATGSTAKRIHVNCNCHFVGGTVSSLPSGSVVVHVLRTGPFDRVLRGQDVTIMTPSAVSGLAAGARVRVIFSASGFFRDPHFDWRNATFTATRVRVKA